MLRQVSRTRSAAAAAVRLASKQTQRHLSVPSKGSPPPKVAAPAAPKAPSSAPPKAPPSPPKAPAAPAAAESSTGSSLPRLLLLGLLTAPAATAVYVKQNPEWNPAALKDDERWLKFRELVLGKEATAVAAKEVTAVVAKQPTPRTPEEFSSAITKGQQAVKKAEKVDKKEQKKVEKAEKKLEKKDHKKVEKVEKKLEKAEKKAEKAEKKVVKLKKEADTKTAVKKVEDKVHHGEKDAKKDVKIVAAAAAGAATAVEKKVDAATVKAREEIAKLAGEAKPEQLSRQMDKQIQATTNDLLSSLKAESNAAAAEMDKQYLSGLHLDANALAIRVAQLATEMKHRSKWEAVRLLESLRRMEEDAQ
ncbi:hypothetical protein BBJ28_00010489, partial [Nothophytophthora sp. Chile5]